MRSNLFIEILKKALLLSLKDFSLTLDELPHYVILKVLSHAQILTIEHKSDIPISIVYYIMVNVYTECFASSVTEVHVFRNAAF